MTDSDEMKKEHETDAPSAALGDTDVSSDEVQSTLNAPPIAVAEIVDDCIEDRDAEERATDHFDTKMDFDKGDPKQPSDSADTTVSAHGDKAFFLRRYVQMISPGMVMVVVSVFGVLLMLLAYAFRAAPQEGTAPLSPVPSMAVSKPDLSTNTPKDTQSDFPVIERIQILEKKPEAALTTGKTLATTKKKITAVPMEQENRTITVTPLERPLLDTRDQTSVPHPAIPAALAAQLERAHNRLDAQERQITELTSRLHRAIAVQQKNTENLATAVENRFVQLQAAKAPAAPQSAVAILAFHDLYRQMQTGQGFDDQWTTLAALVPNNDALRDLKQYATSGLPTLPALQTSFIPFAAKALSEAKRATANTIPARIGASFASVFSVRNVSPTDGDTPAAIISRSQASLLAGDIEKALKELDALQGPARGEMVKWITDAQAKAHAERLLAALKDNITANIQMGTMLSL